MRSPNAIVWINSVISALRFRSGRPPRGEPAAPRWVRRPPQRLLRAGSPVLDRVRRRLILREDHLRLAVLPLADQELTDGRAPVVPLQRSEDGVDPVVAQVIRQRRLVVDAPHLLDGLLEHLAR